MSAVLRFVAGSSLIFLLFGVAGMAVSPASAETNVLFIVDASGSMRAKVEGNETRMSVAKRALSVALKDMPKDARLGMMVYGHRRAKDCKDIELVAPIASEDAASLAERIQKLQPRGETPIAAALEFAVRSFRALKGQNNMIVLVTDGIEECGGDPCAAARAIKAAGLNLKAHIIGFTLNDRQRAAIECVVKETGGTYFEAKNPRGLRDALQTIKKQIAEPEPPSPPPPPPKPERDSVLAQKHGTEVIFASSKYWAETNDGALISIGSQVNGILVGEEAVYAFRAGSAAKFTGFGIYLPAASDTNPKEIELFAGDEGPAGNFRSLGVITPANGRLGDGWQEFKLPETTAKYFKVKVLSNQGQFYKRIILYEFQLYGELLRADAAPSPAPKARLNILARSQGTEIMPGAAQYWSETIDDSLESVGSQINGLVAGDEVIFKFRGGGAATFDTFALYLPGAANVNPKEIELFAGNEGPSGPFRSLGVIKPADGKLRDGWQEFKLPETTANYFKVKLLSNQGQFYKRIILYEMRLYGELK